MALHQRLRELQETSWLYICTSYLTVHTSVRLSTCVCLNVVCMLLSHAPGIIHDYLFQFFSRKSIVFNSKSNNKLITSSTSFYLHYPWQHFLEMVDVAVTLVSINRTPECFNSVNELLFWSWLYFPNVLFQLMPHILYGVSIRWFSRCAPPVDLVLCGWSLEPSSMYA